MDYTYLDYFNYYLKEYISELINTFPETQQPLLANYRTLLEGKDDKNDLYAKCYYTKINNFLGQIAKKDVTLFETPGKIFIEGVDLSVIWNSLQATDANRVAIWKYLQILMILGRKIMPNHKEIVEMLNKISNGELNVPAKVEQTLASEDKDDTESSGGIFGLGDIASSLGGLSSLVSGLTGGGSGGGSGSGGGLGGLGSLLSGLTGGGGEGGEGLGNLMSGITNMFSNPEFTNAMSQLSQQFVPPPPTNGEEHTDDCCNNNEDCKNSECAEKCDFSKNHSHSSSETKSSTDNTSSSNPSVSTPTAPPIFNNALFGELADEISKTFNFDEMEKDGKPANIGEALSRFMSGNNPSKLMGLVGKFGSKLQDEVKKGNINPAELLSQTMSAAGGGQNMQDMMNNPRVQAQMKEMQKNNSSRDRMRAKLAAKKNAEKEGKQD